MSQLTVTLTDAAGASVNSRTLLAAISSPAAGQAAFLTEANREGLFVWSASNLSTQVALDTQQGIYVPPASDVTGASGAWVRKFSGNVDVRWFGAAPDGQTNAFDSAAAILVADAVARHLNKTLSFCGIFRTKMPLVPAGRFHWTFEGSHFYTGELNPGSYLLKDSALNGDLLTVTMNAVGSQIEGGSFIGDTGNGGDGLVMLCSGVTLRRFAVQGMGQDGVRIGAKSGDTASLANLVFLDDLRSGFNGRDGLHIDDETASSIDANAFQANNPKLIRNGRHGLYANRTYLGGTVVAGLFEANAERGIYLDGNANQLIFIGGDVEGNNSVPAPGTPSFSDNVYEVTAFANRFYSICVQGYFYSTENQFGAYTPTITGGSSAGAAATYPTRTARCHVSGKTAKIAINISWTGHTGTGQAYVSLPATLAGPGATGSFATLTSDTAAPQYTPVEVASNGFSIATGGRIVGLINHVGNRIQLYYEKIGDGVTTARLLALALPAAGELYIRGEYDLQQPVHL